VHNWKIQWKVKITAAVFLCRIFLEIRTGPVRWTTDHRLANTGSDQREETKLKVIKGGCLCGASRYVAHGEPINVRVCHCRVCQRSLGAAFNARMLMPLNAVTMTGALGRRNSSPVLVRGFCTVCGTSLFTERASAGVIGLTCGSLDMPEDFQPTEHIWTSSKQAWLTLNDGLPEYPEGAPA
jgi:hypothetical protein